MSKKTYDQGLKDGVQGNPSKENTGIGGTIIDSGAGYLDAAIGGNKIQDSKDYQKGYNEGERIRKS